MVQAFHFITFSPSFLSVLQEVLFVQALLPTKVWCQCHSAFTPPPIKVSERWQGLRVRSGPEQRAPGTVRVPAWTPVKNIHLTKTVGLELVLK